MTIDGGITGMDTETVTRVRVAKSDMSAFDAMDWSTTSFGDRSTWPPRLSAMADFVRISDIAMTLYWGRDWRILYNDRALAGFGARTARIGMTGAEAWGDWWPAIVARLEQVAQLGRSLTLLDEPFVESAGPRAREVFWNLTFWPIFEDDGSLAGILCAARDTSADVFRKRLNRLLVQLDDALIRAESIHDIMAVALELVGEQLGADRVGFGEVDLDRQTVTIREVWAKREMPDVRGTFPLGTFGHIGGDLSQGDTVVIDNSANDPRTSDPAVLERLRRINMQAGLIVPILERGRYAGGIFAQSAAPRVWTAFDIAIAQAATQRLWSALQRLRTDFALRASEQRYRLIFEQAEDIIFTADIDQRITDSNEAGARAIGLTREALIGRSISEFVDAEGFRQTSSMLRRKLDEGGNTRHELPVTSADGRKMRWENNSTLIVDPDKRPIGLLSISRDVTERRAFEERQVLLINELNHRVKNTLALVQAIAHQSFRDGAEPVAAQAGFMARIRTLAGAHDLLTREQWEGVTLAELVGAATAVLETNRVTVSGPHLIVTPKAAVALAMALHELGTNAVKYGALSTVSGSVNIQWRVEEDRLQMTWRESGGPIVAGPERRGFGVKMIERALASDLAAEVSVGFPPDGVTCAIDAPLLGNVT